jgi:hypothetical protein
MWQLCCSQTAERKKAKKEKGEKNLLAMCNAQQANKRG